MSDIFQREIVRLHGRLVSITLDRDSRFTSHFWRSLLQAWGTQLTMSSDFHPRTNDQTEQTIQTLEDMLQACALEWSGSSDESPCLVEFTYNNSCQASIGMAPYEALYGRKCITPICWNEVGERVIEGPELVRIATKQVEIAREKMKELQSRQKSYVDKHRKHVEFQPGDHVFLKVSPSRGIRRFGTKVNLVRDILDPLKYLNESDRWLIA